MDNESSNTTALVAIICIVASTLGSGITSMPVVFKSFGMEMGTLAMVIVGLVTFQSIYSLAYTAVALDKKKTSYSELAMGFSKTLKDFVSLFLALSCLSTVFLFVQRICGIFLFCLRTIPYLTDALSAENKTTVFIIRIVFLALICTAYYFLFRLPDLSSLSFFSNLSIAAAIIFSLVMVYYGVMAPSENLEKQDEVNYTTALGNVIFALHCQSGFPDIINTVKNRSLNNMLVITSISSFFAAFLYGVVGYFGYKGLGNDMGETSILGIFMTPANASSKLVLDDLERRFGLVAGVIAPKIIVGLFGLIFFSGIAFNMFPILPMLQSFVGNLSKKEATEKLGSRQSAAFLATFIVLIFGVFDFSSSLDYILGLFAILFVIPLSFTFPSVFILYLFRKFNFMTLISGLVSISSVLIMIVLLYLELLTGKGKEDGVPPKPPVVPGSN